MNSPLKRFALLACFFLSLHPAQAQLSVWTGGASDDQWSSAANWNPTGEPTGDALIETTASITLPATATSVTAIDIYGNSNTVMLTGSTTTNFTTDYLYVYNTGSLSLSLPTGAQFTVSEDGSFIGDGTYGTGSFTVSGNGTLAFTSGVDPLYIGAGNPGVMNQTGGTVAITGAITVGSDGDEYDTGGATGTGVYNLSGTSTFTADEILLGVGTSATAPPATGTFNMTGGEVNATDVILGVNGVSSTGTVNGDTGVVTQSAGIFNANTLEVGESPGGIGVYNLSGTGTLTVATLLVGDLAGSSGTVMQSAGTATVTELSVGVAGTGTYSISGGSLTVTAGSFFVGEQTGSGVVNQSGGSVTTVGATPLTVGIAGAGTYHLSGGTLTTNGTLGVGLGAGTGTFVVSGGTLNANGAITLVGAGTGTGVFVLSSGILNATSAITVGNTTGAATFTYSGGTLNYSAGINVGSTGTFNQETNFDLSTAAGNPVSLLAGATYNLDSGTLTIGGPMTTLGFSGINASGAAIFNFAGGSVRPTGTDWYDALDGSVTGNSTIDTTTNNAFLSGTLAGSGTLTVIGTNTVTIDTGGGGNSSAASWSVNVQGGTVMADASTYPSTGNIMIGSTGTVVMADSGPHALGGNIGGAGAFTATFTAVTDTLELTGAVSLTGATTLQGGGTLQVLQGSFNTIAGADGDNLVIGAGSGSGTVSITGAASYTGSTTINAGYTLLASNISGGGTITNNGTLGAYGPVGTSVTLNGPLNSSGDLLIRMNGASFDQFAVHGSADITGSITLINPGGNGQYDIVTTTTGISYSGPTTLTANRLVSATVAPVGDDLVLTLSSVSINSLAGINLTPNEAAVAASLDPLVLNSTGLSPKQQQNFNTLINLIAPTGVSNQQLAQNLEELTPQSLQYAQAIAYEHSAFLVSTVDGFDNALHHEFSGFDTSAINLTMPGFDSGIGRQMQSLLAFDPPSFHQTAPNGVNYYPGSESTPADETPSSPEPSSQIMSDSPTTAPMPMRTEPQTVTIRKPYSNFSVFVGGDGTIANLNQSQGASYAPSSKASYTSVDAIGGISYRMTSNLAAGVLFDYSHTDADTDNYGSKTKVDSYSPGVFATYGDKGFYVNGLFSYGRNNYSNQRVVPVVDGVASSNPDGNQYTGALDAGYDLHPAQGWTLTPAGGLTYTHLDIDSFTETGADPANLNVDAQHDDSLRSRLGGYVNYETIIGQIALLPTFSAMWQHEFLDENAPITSQFNDFSSGAFTVHSVSMGRDSALISVGLTAELSNSMAIFVNCSADVNGNYNAEDFVGGFKGSF